MAFALTGAAATAQQGEGRKEAREANKDVKEAKEDRKEARKDLRDAVKDGGDAKEARKDLKEANKNLRDSRDERRNAAKDALKAKWGEDLLAKPAVRAELKLHAQRMAKLQTMKRVADSAGKKEIEARVDKLTEKENARHQTRMAALKAKNGEDT